MKVFWCACCLAGLVVTAPAQQGEGFGGPPGGPGGPRGPHWHGSDGPAEALTPEQMKQVRTLLKQANQADSVKRARRHAKDEMQALMQHLQQRGRVEAPDLAAKLEELGFRWQPPRAAGRGPGLGPRAGRGGPRRGEALERLSREDRRALRQLMRRLMAEEETRHLRRRSDQAWKAFKAELRKEVKALDPELAELLEKQAPRRGRRGPGRGARRGGDFNRRP